MTLRVQAQVLPFLNHFPVLSLSFSLLFVLVKFMFGTVTGRSYGGWSELTHPICLPPRLSAETQERSNPGGPSAKASLGY